MKNKKVLTIILVFLVILLGGASVYVATQLNARKSVAPTAPESKPKADEPVQLTYVGSAECAVTGVATDTACVATEVITCTPDCPTACGAEATTITTCTDSCGVAATKACPATAACTTTVLEGSKTAYKNATTNSAGSYTLTSEMATVSKSQIYVYTITLHNTSETITNSVVLKDSLVDMPVTYMDTVAGCTFSTTNNELTCNTSINPDQTKKFSFRVKASDGIANGTVITNTAKVTYPDGSLDLTKELVVSTVVGCNHTCTTDAECSTGLTCDATTSMCRKAACAIETDCVCTVATAPTATATVRLTASPTRVATAAATPTILPETGIFDLPGIAAFGGGLLLAVVGILLAL
jgi:flagellar basal body-associated protein FliL